MKSRVIDEFDRIKEIRENGEIVWTEEDSVRRDKISSESREKLKDAVKENGYQDFQELVLEILTGKTVKEIEDSEGSEESNNQG